MTECEIPGCEESVESFPEPFLLPPGIPHRGDRAAIMCDRHHVSARILAYSRKERPYVDIGLYQEVVFYARQLAGEVLGISDPTELVEQPSNDDSDEEHHDE